jgi:hypothetical protein
VLFLRKALPPTDIYSALTGTAPDTQEDRPKEGVRLQTGSRSADRILQVIFAPVRLDIVASSVIGADILGGASPILGDFRVEIQNFATMIRDWLPKCDFPVLRLALVAKALAPADTSVGAYEILKDNLKSVEVRPGEMRDLLFRVNWRAPTTAMPEGYLNRLTTWTALRFGVRASVPGGPELATIERHYAQREIDVNTPVEHDHELPRDGLVHIFSELFEVVLRTAELGEGA